MPTRSPYETFNVFDLDVQKELLERKKSTNLLEIRTPFLRYTTTVEFPTKEWYEDLARTAGATAAFDYIAPFNLNRYNGCKFFTLGLHGWDNEAYNDSDIYGMRADAGLIVGSTYSEGKQQLVRTNNGIGKALGERYESPQGYPPPGIESATVERLRNGNVLKFTLNAVCYTQQQLQMLEFLAFSPGMTCILEWGNIISTPSGQKGLNKDRILNFKNVRDTEIILNFWLSMFTGGLRRRGISQGARSLFIDSFCKPNKFHYDFAIARIANVKTNIEDNKYKISVIAYGVADNIMYISAYATNNSEVQENTNNSKDQVITSSVREYFAPRAKFIFLLDSRVDSDDEIVKFDEPDDAEYKDGPGAAAGSGTPTNDLGQEQTFYITLNRFINYFLNDSRDGLASILNNTINIADSVDAKNNSNFGLEILEDLQDIQQNPIKVGYNEVLRSTDPSTLLIVNPKAFNNVGQTKLSNFRQNLKITQEGQLRVSKAVTKLIANQLRQVDEEGKQYSDGNPSGIASAMTGIWINSKLIQSVFLEARTIHEGIETLLNKINAATEGYWDLSLIYDEEQSNFRIVDNNLKIIPKKQQLIYTFNKRLPNNPSAEDTITGPEVLDIRINADYPKLLVSQLGISAINNSSGSPNRRDLQYARNPLMGPRLWDLLRKDKPVKKDDSKKPTPTSLNTSTIDKFVEVSLKGALYNDNDNQKGTRASIRQQLNAGGFNSLPTTTKQILGEIFAIQRPLTKLQAQEFATRISGDDLTNDQIDAIKSALALRTKAIINRAKSNELKSFDNGVDAALAIKTKTNISAQIKQVKNNIENNRKELIQLIDSRLPTSSTTNPNELRPSQQIATVPGAIR